MHSGPGLDGGKHAATGYMLEFIYVYPGNVAFFVSKHLLFNQKIKYDIQSCQQVQIGNIWE